MHALPEDVTTAVDDDTARTDRAMAVTLRMGKPDIAALEGVAAGHAR